VNCAARALMATGVIFVNINPGYRLYELECALKQSECDYLLSGESLKDLNYEQMICEVQAKTKLPEIRQIRR
jgi:non-ribosomal peptide synthetase component E (peptide arylation enzyme)